MQETTIPEHVTITLGHAKKDLEKEERRKKDIVAV